MPALARGDGQGCIDSALHGFLAGGAAHVRLFPDPVDASEDDGQDREQGDPKRQVAVGRPGRMNQVGQNDHDEEQDADQPPQQANGSFLISNEVFFGHLVWKERQGSG